MVADTSTNERWFYRYDPFGRRIGKRCDQIAEVRHYRDGQLVSRRHWVHNGWELLVQQRQNADASWETDFVTSGHNGEPQAIFNQSGELRWQAPRANVWGQRYTDKAEKHDPGLAFAGQYRDDESGLCYNRFRYYDPSGGCYISPDPIGVLGGENNYGYVQNPNTWVDPLGLAGENTFIHYTNQSGFESIMQSGVINQNISGKVYITDILMSPNDVMRDLLINNPTHAGRGDYAIIFKVDPGQANNIHLSSRLEYIHAGKLRLDNILYAGKNPYGIYENLDYSTRLKLMDNQVKIRKCGG